MSLGIGTNPDTVSLLLARLPKEERVYGGITKSHHAPEVSDNNNELFDTKQIVKGWKTNYQWHLTIEPSSFGKIADALLNKITHPEDTEDRFSASPTYTTGRTRRIRRDTIATFAIYRLDDQGKITQAILNGQRGQSGSVVQGGVFFREKDKEKVCAVISRYGIVKSLSEVILDAVPTLNANVVSVITGYLKESFLWELKRK